MLSTLQEHFTMSPKQVQHACKSISARSKPILFAAFTALATLFWVGGKELRAPPVSEALWTPALKCSNATVTQNANYMRGQ